MRRCRCVGSKPEQGRTLPGRQSQCVRVLRPRTPCRPCPGLRRVPVSKDSISRCFNPVKSRGGSWNQLIFQKIFSCGSGKSADNDSPALEIPSFDTTVRQRPDRSRPPQAGAAAHVCTESADRKRFGTLRSNRSFRKTTPRWRPPKAERETERPFAPLRAQSSRSPCPAAAAKPQGRIRGDRGKLFLTLQKQTCRHRPAAPDTLYGLHDLHDGGCV